MQQAAIFPTQTVVHTVPNGYNMQMGQPKDQVLPTPMVQQVQMVPTTVHQQIPTFQQVPMYQQGLTSQQVPMAQVPLAHQVPMHQQVPLAQDIPVTQQTAAIQDVIVTNQLPPYVQDNHITEQTYH